MDATALITAEQLTGASELGRIGELIRRNKLAEAGKRLDVLLARDRSQPTVLRLAAVVESRSENHEEAVRLAEESLAGDLTPAAYRRNLDAFLAIATAASDQVSVGRVLDRGLPLDDAGEGLAQDDVEVLLSLAEQLVTWRRTTEGLALTDAFRAEFKDSAKGLALTGVLKARGERCEEALSDLAEASKREPLSPLALLAGRAAATATGDYALARSVSKEILNRFPAYLTKQRFSQEALIGVASIFRRQPDARVLSLPEFYFPENFISQLFRRYKDEYRILSIFFNSGNAMEAARLMPKPDIIFNGNVNAEEILRFNSVNKIKHFMDYWSRPIINQPSDVIKSTRIENARLFSRIDGLLAPKIELFKRGVQKAALVKEVESRYSYPVILRGTVEQQGGSMYLAGNRTELDEILILIERLPEFYVIQFVKSVHNKGYYRKIRAAVAGDTIQIIRVDFDESWNVHGRQTEKRARFYLSNRELLEQEATIAADPDRYLGPDVTRILTEIRRRLPLDVFGIDFDVMADGRVLFFEANASMNLLSTADPRVDYPKDAEAVFMDGFRQLVRQTMREQAARPA